MTATPNLSQVNQLNSSLDTSINFDSFKTNEFKEWKENFLSTPVALKAKGGYSAITATLRDSQAIEQRYDPDDYSVFGTDEHDELEAVVNTALEATLGTKNIDLGKKIVDILEDDYAEKGLALDIPAAAEKALKENPGIIVEITMLRMGADIKEEKIQVKSLIDQATDTQTKQRLEEALEKLDDMEGDLDDDIEDLREIYTQYQVEKVAIHRLTRQNVIGMEKRNKAEKASVSAFHKLADDHTVEWVWGEIIEIGGFKSDADDAREGMINLVFASATEADKEAIYEAMSDLDESSDEEKKEKLELYTKTINKYPSIMNNIAAIDRCLTLDESADNIARHILQLDWFKSVVAERMAEGNNEGVTMGEIFQLLSDFDYDQIEDSEINDLNTETSTKDRLLSKYNELKNGRRFFKSIQKWMRKETDDYDIRINNEADLKDLIMYEKPETKQVFIKVINKLAQENRDIVETMDTQAEQRELENQGEFDTFMENISEDIANIRYSSLQANLEAAKTEENSQEIDTILMTLQANEASTKERLEHDSSLLMLQFLNGQVNVGGGASFKLDHIKTELQNDPDSFLKKLSLDVGAGTKGAFAGVRYNETQRFSENITAQETVSVNTYGLIALAELSVIFSEAPQTDELVSDEVTADVGASVHGGVMLKWSNFSDVLHNLKEKGLVYGASIDMKYADRVLKQKQSFNTLVSSSIDGIIRDGENGDIETFHQSLSDKLILALDATYEQGEERDPKEFDVVKDWADAITDRLNERNYFDTDQAHKDVIMRQTLTGATEEFFEGKVDQYEADGWNLHKVGITFLTFAGAAVLPSVTFEKVNKGYTENVYSNVYQTWKSVNEKDLVQTDSLESAIDIADPSGRIIKNIRSVERDDGTRVTIIDFHDTAEGKLAGNEYLNIHKDLYNNYDKDTNTLMLEESDGIKLKKVNKNLFIDINDSGAFAGSLNTATNQVGVESDYFTLSVLDTNDKRNETRSGGGGWDSGTVWGVGGTGTGTGGGGTGTGTGTGF